MQALTILGFLLSFVAFAGTGTLTNRSTGQTITQDFFNDIHSALNSDFVGRNSSGVATSGQNLGNGTYRWALSATTGNFNGVVTIPLGAENAPSISFSGDSNTGIWSSGADTIDLSVNAVRQMRLDSSGLLTVNQSGSTNTHVIYGKRINLESSSSTAGAMYYAFSNVANSAAHAAVFLEQTQASGGDAYLRLATPSVDWATGIDNDSSDAFKISNSSGLGTNDFVTISTAGLITLGASGGTQTHVVNGLLNVVTNSTDDYGLTSRSSNTTGVTRIRLANSNTSRIFELKAVFTGSAEEIVIGSDSADLMSLNRAGSVVSFPNLGTTAAASATATLTNAPAGAAGNPDIWFNLKIGGTTYVIPAWTP